MTAKLTPEVEDLLQRMRALNMPAFHTLTPVEARGLREQTAALTAGESIETDGTVDDRLIDGAHGAIPVRFYTPRGWQRGSVAYFHGGGWVMGDLDTHDALCRGLTNASGLRVMAVQYRLAPEHSYPAAMDDAWAATRWLAEDDPGAIAVGGDSAGGTLATCVAARARGTDLDIAAQLLIYPVTDMRKFETASYAEFSEGYWLTRKAMEWFRNHYAPDESVWKHPDVSPLYRDDLTAMPPAMVITAHFDVLRDEGAVYARRLREAGVEVTYRCYDGMIHGFMAMPGVFPQGAAALVEAGEMLRGAVSLTDG